METFSCITLVKMKFLHTSYKEGENSGIEQQTKTSKRQIFDLPIVKRMTHHSLTCPRQKIIT